MCLNIDSRIKTAKEPITVYKTLYSRNDGSYYSPFWYCGYRIGEEKSVPQFGFNYWSGFLNFVGRYINLQRVEVYEGLHAYRFLDEAEVHAYSPGAVVVECIIPKGARYIVGRNQDIVSTRLIVGDVVYSLNAEKETP
jgi:hypothetical protein